MKIFIKQCMKFLFILFLGFLIIFCFFSIAPTIFDKNYRLHSTATSILIGDSHVQNSFNDQMNENYSNLAHHAESYYFSYHKLKLILSTNPQIKKVYLGYSYHSLSNYYNDYISGIYSQAVSSDFFFSLSLKEQLNCMYWNMDEFPLYMRKNFKIGFENLIRDEGYSFKGGYYNHQVDTISIPLVKRRIHGQFYLNGNVRGFSKINLEYLNHIINLCQSKKIELVLFNSPLHKEYRKSIPVEYLIKYHEIILKNELTVLDLSDLEMDDDSYLRDGDHVTEKGAICMTNSFLAHEKN